MLISRNSRTAVLALALAGAAHASIITNIQYQSGATTYCLSTSTSGACAGITTAGALTNGSNTSNTFSYTITLTDGDKYLLTGNYSASYTEANGSLFSVNPILTYVSGTAQADTIVVDWFEGVFDNSNGSYNGLYTENANLCNGTGLGSGSSVKAQYIVNSGDVNNSSSTDGTNTALPALGPYSGAGCQNSSNSMTLSGLTNNLIGLDWEFTFNFAAGSSPGASEGVMPEPAETIPAALTLGWFAYVTLRRKQRKEPR